MMDWNFKTVNIRGEKKNGTWKKMVKYYFSKVGKHSIDKVIFFLEGKKTE
jgi:hypothetical protein